MPASQAVAHRTGTLDWGVGHRTVVVGEGDAETDGGGTNVGPGADSEFGEDAADVVVDRLRREEEWRGDLGVAPAGGEQGQNLQLAGGQVRRVGAGARARIARDVAGAELAQPSRRHGRVRPGTEASNSASASRTAVSSPSASARAAS